MEQFQRVLGRPMLHLLLGAVFFVVFMWPFLAFSRPVDTWKWLYGSWAVAVACIAVVNIYGTSADDEDDDDDEEGDHV